MHGNRLKLSPTLNNKTGQNKRNFLFKNSGTKVDFKKNLLVVPFFNMNDYKNAKTKSKCFLKKREILLE